jgi:hypothetical protein
MQIVSMKRSILTGTLVLSVLGIAPLGRAQTPDDDRAAARTAANEGLQAFEAGDYARAIEQFERANEIIRAPTHTLYLARAHAVQGRLLKARELYAEIDRQQLDANAPPPFVQAQQDARMELKAVEARIPRVTVEIMGPGDESAQITMNDEPVPAEMVGIARRVDPGTYLFRASSDKSRARSVKLVIAEGERKTVNLELEADAPAPPPVPAAKGSADTGGSSVIPVIGYSAIGVGVIGLGLGFYFNKQKGDREEEADSLFSTCNPRVCTAEERTRIDGIDDDAHSNGRSSLISFAAGAVAIAGGVTLLLVAPSGDVSKDTSSSTIRPWVGIGSAGLSGSF